MCTYLYSLHFLLGIFVIQLGFLLCMGFILHLRLCAIVSGFFIEIDLFLPQVHFILDLCDWYRAFAIQFI